MIAIMITAITAKELNSTTALKSGSDSFSLIEPDLGVEKAEAEGEGLGVWADEDVELE